MRGKDPERRSRIPGVTNILASDANSATFAAKCDQSEVKDIPHSQIDGDRGTGAGVMDGTYFAVPIEDRTAAGSARAGHVVLEQELVGEIAGLFLERREPSERSRIYVRGHFFQSAIIAPTWEADVAEVGPGGELARLLLGSPIDDGGERFPPGNLTVSTPTSGV